MSPPSRPETLRAVRPALLLLAGMLAMATGWLGVEPATWAWLTIGVALVWEGLDTWRWWHKR